MKITKVLNNNAVVIKEEGVEKIAMGPGIAFHKSKNDLINPSKIEKYFILKDENKKFQELLESVPESHIALAEDIISYAEKQLGTDLNDHIHIALTDHLTFAIERIQKGIPIKNRLANEIKNLYRQEFEIALWAIDYIQEKLNIHLPSDEAAFIALHIHTAKMNLDNVESSIKKTMMIQDTIDIISSDLDLQIDEESIDYQRLLTHLHFTISRLENNDPFHEMDRDMFLMIKEKYETSYHCALNIRGYLQSEHSITLPDAEIGYISIHIQRIYEKASAHKKE